MLDNLMNPDLSGVTGSIHYVYDNSVEVFPQMLIALVSILAIFGLFAILLKVIDGSKSKRYRELLSDMYVVGRVKQFAEEDKIDLMEELAAFRRVLKRNNVNCKSVDEVVSMELKEKILEKSDNSKPTKK